MVSVVDISMVALLNVSMLKLALSSKKVEPQRAASRLLEVFVFY